MSKKSILIIDDNEADNFLNKLRLKKLGFEGEIFSFTNPEDGLRFLHQRALDQSLPDLLFLDINMPGTTGWEIIDKIARSETFDNDTLFPIVIMTTSLNPDEKLRAEKSQIISFFTNKPISTETYQTILSKCNLL